MRFISRSTSHVEEKVGEQKVSTLIRKQNDANNRKETTTKEIANPRKEIGKKFRRPISTRRRQKGLGGRLI